MNEPAENTRTIDIPGLDSCCCCPRDCKVNRNAGKTGYCGSDAGFNVSSMCVHRGEEPAISGKHGICNIFFSRCNLTCIYCQNWQISRNRGVVQEKRMTLEEVIEEAVECLDLGCHAVGFVSPSHYIPHVRIIIEELRKLSRNPVFVYNTNAYDKVDELKRLEGLVDVYLPDFKYFDAIISKEYSGAVNYPEVAKAALKEMYRQKGSVLMLDDLGQAEWGMIIRHLVLPGQVQNSIDVLRWIADELSTSVAVSVMSQYYPTPAVINHPELGRVITAEEFKVVTDEMVRLGFYKGWVQEMESPELYRPDFSMENPFEHKKKER
jgi:putative pyruvate formate lyase activating enzyme